MSRQYAVLVVMNNGHMEYMCSGVSSQVAKFRSKEAAQEQAKFLKMGMDDADSIDVVICPSDASLKAEGYDV